MEADRGKGEDPLETALRGLRKGQGLSLAKLNDSPLVLELLGERDVHAALERFESLVRSLGDGRAARALANAYALDAGVDPLLTKRRGDFAALEDVHRDTIEADENKAIRELKLKLRRWLPAHFDTKMIKLDARIEGGSMVRLQVSRYAETHHESLSITTEQLNTNFRKSIPALIYAVTDDPQLEVIEVSIFWEGPPYPANLVQVSAPDFFELLTLPPKVANFPDLVVSSETMLSTSFKVSDVRPYYFGVFWMYPWPEA